MIGLHICPFQRIYKRSKNNLKKQAKCERKKFEKNKKHFRPVMQAHGLNAVRDIEGKN